MKYFSKRFPLWATVSMSRQISSSFPMQTASPSVWLYPKDNPSPRVISHFLSICAAPTWYSFVENVICMENIFGTTVKLTDLQGNAIPYEIEDGLLHFTVNAKGTAPVAVRVQI